LVEHQTVQVSSPRFRRRLAALALIGAALALSAAAPALAVEPPDLSFSFMTCTDTDGAALRPGDDVTCKFYAVMLGGTESAVLTADAPLPASLVYAASGGFTSYDAGTHSISFPAAALGLTFPGNTRIGEFHGTVADVPVGTAITPTASVVATGTEDGAVVSRQLAVPAALVVDPPPPDLAASGIACDDVGGGQLLPGDEVSCDLTIDNAANREAAAGLTGQLALPGTTWVSGGTSHTGTMAFFNSTVGGIGDLSSGGTKTVNAHFQVSLAALGGEAYFPAGFLSGSGIKSGELTQTVSGPGLTVSPGPAELSPSSLVCTDPNGGLVLAGDDLLCRVTVLPAAGHQGVVDATATIAVPFDTDPGDGPDSLSAGVMTFDSSLGDVAAGTSKIAPFHLRIRNGTPTGTDIVPSGTLTATSIPAGVTVQRQLHANRLTVGERPPALPGETPTPDAPGALAVPDAVPPATAAKGYKLKAKTIRIKLRRGQGRRRGFVYVKKFVTRTPKATGNLVRKVTVPKKGKYAPKRGKVKIKGTRLTYTLPKGKKAKDRFHYTVVDRAGKKATGFVVVTRQKAKKKKKP
jgi:hypothetical protein